MVRLARVLACACACALTLPFPQPVRADARADRTAIAARLQRWADAFNRRDATAVCDLFAPDLVATVPGAGERGRRAVCANLSAVLEKRDERLRYRPLIHEILVADDLAVVRLTWTLIVTRHTVSATSTESGMDIFRRGRNGTWSIVRFLAFTNRPEDSIPQ